MVSSRDPCFVLTLPRSGSTLLRQLLDGHPQICCPPESQVAACASTVLSNWLEFEDASSTGEERRQLAIRQIRQLVGKYARWHLEKSGKVQFCDKSLPNIDHISALLTAFPRARVICLYRHAMDVIASCIEACRWG